MRVRIRVGQKSRERERRRATQVDSELEGPTRATAKKDRGHQNERASEKIAVVCGRCDGLTQQLHATNHQRRHQQCRRETHLEVSLVYLFARAFPPLIVCLSVRPVPSVLLPVSLSIWFISLSAPLVVWPATAGSRPRAHTVESGRKRPSIMMNLVCHVQPLSLSHEAASWVLPLSAV